LIEISDRGRVKTESEVPKTKAVARDEAKKDKESKEKSKKDSLQQRLNFSDKSRYEDFRVIQYTTIEASLMPFVLG
jgi:hypothetical protein